LGGFKYNLKICCGLKDFFIVVEVVKTIGVEAQRLRLYVLKTFGEKITNHVNYQSKKRIDYEKDR